MQLPQGARSWDTGLFIAGCILVLISSVVMLSAAMTMSIQIAHRHLFWIGVGLVAHGLVAYINYKRWADFAAVLYGLGIATLVLVEIAGTVRLGATRWLSIFGVSFQPSELAKLATLWWLARYLAGHTMPLPGGVVICSALIAAPPIALILIQPDLGTASVIGVIWLGIVWAAGLHRKVLFSMVGIGLALLPLGWQFLKEYQKTRVMVFLNPYADPLGSGYTIIQSMIAIGSGGIAGTGWRQGTQSQLKFLPEHHSDFIFSVIGEEWGLIGGAVVIAAFLFLLWRILKVAQEAVDPQGRLLAIGVFSWIGYQTFVNIGMVMGLLPVVGVPLPFISYGGSSMLNLWIALGLVQSIKRYGSG